MKARTFWKTVVNDRSDFLERLLAALGRNGIEYCVIGGQGVNAYTDPLVSLDLNLAVALEDIERAEAALSAEFKLERFRHSLNVSAPESDLRAQIQTDPRYAGFVARAQVLEVLGVEMPVADLADILQGKVWAASDPARRPSKRLKDLTDISRILDIRPALRDLVPPAVLDRLL